MWVLAAALAGAVTACAAPDTAPKREPQAPPMAASPAAQQAAASPPAKAAPAAVTQPAGAAPVRANPPPAPAKDTPVHRKVPVSPPSPDAPSLPPGERHGGSAVFVPRSIRPDEALAGRVPAGSRVEADADVGLRASKAEIRSRMIGVYGGQRWGGFGVQGGLSHAAHEIDGERTAAFANFSNGLKSRYDGSTDQAFVEAGYLFGGAAWQIEPYLQYANVRVETDAFTETGGVAALHAGSGESKLDLATGGLRFSLNLKGAQQEQTWLSLRGGLAYRQANGDVTPASATNFAGSGVFTVQGAPLAKKATLGELGIAARLSERTLLELGYTGQFADEGNDHGANARISVRF